MTARGDPVLLLEPRPAEAAFAAARLAAGQDVLLTPRPWLSAAALDRLERAARAGGARLAVVNPERARPSRRLLRQQIESGHLGRPGLVRLHRWLPVASPEAPAGDGAGAAGALPLACAPDLDVALWLMGALPDVVYAVERDGQTLLVHLGFPGGGMALLDYAAALPPGDGYEALSVIGASGAAYADDHHNSQLLFRGGHPAALRVDERGWEAEVLAGDLAAAFDAGIAGWRGVLAVAGAVCASIASGRACAPEDV